MKTLLVGLLALSSFVGCASYSPNGAQQAGPGQAAYHYKKSADGSCEVIITSARDVPGIKASVTKDCGVKVEAEALSGEKLQLQMMSLMGAILQLLPNK